MPDIIASEIERFLNFPREAGPRLTVESICDQGFLVTPKDRVPVTPPGKRIALTLMGLTHGNEYGGVAVLNELLAHLSAGTVDLRIAVAFVLGNPWAALENKRFLECDLNRSFARAEPKLREELRARELMGVLRQTGFIVDYHQTMRPSERPFFIFSYNRRSFAFARAIGPRQTVVTHWGKPFSAEGMCSDEYVVSQGGTGVTIELGQNGFDPYQIAVGVDCGLWALRWIAGELSGEPLVRPALAVEPELYTWADITPWPASGLVELDDGWVNFKEVVAGQRLGTVDGQPLVARASGRMLFPKYLPPEQQRVAASRPTELCRIMKRIGSDELPKDR